MHFIHKVNNRSLNRWGTERKARLGEISIKDPSLRTASAMEHAFYPHVH
jgi:hypothetical protein